MEDKPSPQDVIRLIASLQHAPEAQRVEAMFAAGPTSPELAALRAWQAQRLAATYADLLADAQFAPACRFFLDDLYGAHDFHRRDADAERLHAILARYLPAAMLRLLADALTLNRLSAARDARLAAALAQLAGPGQTLAPERIDAGLYGEGYRLCDNQAERRAQIALLADVLSEAAHGGRGLIFAAGLRLARRPAIAAGWQELHDFLARGVAACRPLKAVDAFVETIRRRETIILENLFAGRPDPFDVR